MKGKRCTALVTLLLLAVGQAELAVSPGDQIELTVDVVVHPASGITRSKCQDRVTVHGHMKRQWWVAIRGTRPVSEDRPEKEGGQIRCGSGLVDTAGPDFGGEQAHPDLIAEISMVLRLNRVMLDARILVVEVVIALQRRSGSDNQGKPVYQVSESHRELYFSRSGSAFIPLLISSPDGNPDAGTG